ncbi:MAG: transketolase [Clostridia bacterium]|nr:transketolase [Clostridia bacterium]
MDYEKITKEIRKEIFLTAFGANIAHIASAFSIVEVMYVLYEQKILHYDPLNPTADDRDWFILSKGHGSLALYYELYKCGFFDKDMLRSFSKPGTVLGGEPCYPLTPGVECSSGSLGHGLSFAVGVAKSKKIDGRNENVYCLVGDGECEEGSTWEALMFASHMNLDNLIILVDCNKIQKMDSVEKVIGIKSLKPYFETFGCDVYEVDGHNIDEIRECLQNMNTSSKPKAVLLNTVKGKGVSIIENNANWHWRLPKKKELKYFMQELNISEEEVEYAKSLRNSVV